MNPWGRELTYDYDERTSLFSVRDGALIAGTLIAAASPAIIKAVFDISENHQENGMCSFSSP